MRHTGFGRCDACDVILTDYEMSCKDIITGEYIGLCTECCKAAQLFVSGNPNLLDNNDTDNFFDDFIVPDED